MSQEIPPPQFSLPPAAPPAGPPMAPPVGPPQLPAGDPNAAKKRGAIATLLLAIGAKIKTFFAFILPALKFLKLGKILLTSSTMLISIWVYSMLFGWPLAVLFVFGILVHEMGHVYVAWLYGAPVSAPMFIPGFGALIIGKKNFKIWEGAVIGIGGPIGGTLAALTYWALYGMTSQPVFLAASYITFFMNLFNMTPMYPLDGGRIVAAVNVWLWVVGLVMITCMTIFGFISNPMIFVLILLSVPKIFTDFKNRRSLYLGPNSPTPRMRQKMGLSYVGLIGLLVVCMSETHAQLGHLREVRRAMPAQSHDDPSLEHRY